MKIVDSQRAVVLPKVGLKRIQAVIPHAKPLVLRGRPYVAVRHGMEESVVLRNMGYPVPSPILHYYEWPRSAEIANPFAAQLATAAFLTLNRRAYVLNGLGCIEGDAEISTNRCGATRRMSLRELYRRFHNPGHTTDTSRPWKARCLKGDQFGNNEIEDVIAKGVKSTIRIALEDGTTLRVTPDHRMMVPGGWQEAGKLSVGDTLVCNGRTMVACPSCDVEREVAATYAPLARKRMCRACKGRAHSKLVSGDRNPAWSGGRYVDNDGYVLIHKPDHHRARESGHVLEHIVVAERKCGFEITSEYHVHHVNGIKDDNRPENLEVLLPADHHREHKPRTHLDGGRSINGGRVVVLPKHKKIASITDGGEVDVYDVSMAAPHHNFVVNGVVVHNSGKTQATLWAYDYLRSEGRAVKMIVVAPLSTLELTWAQALFDHFPHLSFMVVHAARAKRLKMIDEDVDVYITNHDGVKIIMDKLATRFDITHVVVDEIAQCARNAKTDRWKALNTIVNKQLPRACWGLTATPTPNEPTDAWAQCRLVTPETVPRTFTRFRDQLMRQVGPYLWLPREGAMDTVHQVMQPAIRFSREECVDLPPTTYTEHHVPLTKEQEVAYKLMENTLKAQVDTGEVTAVNEAVKANKLVQIACGVVYDGDHEVLELPNQNRVQETLDLIKDSASAVIVFVPFVAAVEYVAKQVENAGYSVGIVHGGIGKTARDEVFNSFQRARTLDVIVAQPAAMSHGLTLTAASTIVWYAPITSADIFEQANGRITRPSQTHNTLIAMISGTMVERKMYKRLKNKQKMQNLLLDLVVDGREA